MTELSHTRREVIKMILKDELDNLTMCYDFTERRLSLNIKNSEDNSQTQINIGQEAIDKLETMLEVIRMSNRVLPSRIEDFKKD
mgnify:FL=1